MESNINEYVDLLKNVFSENHTTDPEQQNEQEISQETEKIRSLLFRTFYCIDDESKQRVFIRNLHARLVSLNDHFYEIFQVDKAEQNEENRNPVRQFILETLHHLVISIHEHFPQCCNGDQKIPEYSRAVVTDEILEKLEGLGLATTDPDYTLFEEVKASVSRRFNEPIVPYGLISYLQSFIKEIIRIRENNRKKSLQINLTDLLISFNFNSVSVIPCLVSAIQDEASKIETAKDKITFLNHWLKRVSQSPVSPAGAFDTRREPACDFLHKWISEEVAFHEKSLILNSGVPYGNGFPFAGNGTKFELNLSVQQIACLIWLFIECGVIKNGGKRDLSTFIAEHFCSKKQENISPESLRVKSYSFDESTREKVRLLILTMLKRVSSPM
jgi:hypothetical protein